MNISRLKVTPLHRLSETHPHKLFNGSNLCLQALFKPYTLCVGRVPISFGEFFQTVCMCEWNTHKALHCSHLSLVISLSQSNACKLCSIWSGRVGFARKIRVLFLLNYFMWKKIKVILKVWSHSVPPWYLWSTYHTKVFQNVIYISLILALSELCNTSEMDTDQQPEYKRMTKCCWVTDVSALQTRRYP